MTVRDVKAGVVGMLLGVVLVMGTLSLVKSVRHHQDSDFVIIISVGDEIPAVGRDGHYWWKFTYPDIQEARKRRDDALTILFQTGSSSNIDSSDGR